MNVEDLKLTSGRLYWQPSGQSSWVDFGNVISYAEKPDIQRVEHKKKEDGLGIVDSSIARLVAFKFSITLEERFAEVLALLGLAKQLADVIQAGGAGNFTIQAANLVANKSLFLGAYNVSNYAGVTSVGAVTLVEGVDFAIETRSGMVTPLPDSTNLGAGNWVFTFNSAALTQLAFSTLSKLLSTGTFKFIEKDQHSFVPRATADFTGQCEVTAWGENSLEKFNEFQLEVIHTP